jgi:hypothetical protein
MIQTEEMYGDNFFKSRHKYNWRSPIVCGAIAAILDPIHSAIDVGCAVGDLVAGFQELGLVAIGIEGSTACVPYLVCPRESVAISDMRKPLGESDRFDVCTCFEVAEHLEEECAAIFVDNLCRLSDQLIISACPPHPTKKPSKYHLNEQPSTYWDALFEEQGYGRRRDWEEMLRTAWHPWRRKYGVAAFHQNLLCYSRKTDA